MINCFFVSDLHGHVDRYDKLFRQIRLEKPEAVFFFVVLLPHALRKIEHYNDFTNDYLFPQFFQLKKDLKEQYPDIFIILGNDDARSEEANFMLEGLKGLFQYINQQKVIFRDYPIYGYSFVPPTPFQLKDWEKYDVSRYVDPGCIHPNEGFRTVNPNHDIEYASIQNDLLELTKNEDVSNAIFLFHSPPYKSYLDRAALDGMKIDYVPLDIHVGSIAIMRYIEERQPLLTLHGHIHESTRLTGRWNQKIGKTLSLNAAHDGPELAIIKFDLNNLYLTERVLI